MQGLFRYIQKGGKVTDLKVSGIVQPSGSKQELGGIVGNNSGEILNCSFSRTLVGIESVGGIAGINETTGSIKNCRSSASVTADRYAGGITGKNLGSVYYSANEAKSTASYTQKRDSNAVGDSSNGNTDILSKFV